MAVITKRTVDAAKAGAKDAFVWDDDVPGFGLKVTPAGGRIYVFQYRLGGRGGTTRRYTIGKHGAFTPEQARRRAKDLAGLVHQGTDPIDSERSDHAAKETAKRKLAEQARIESDLVFEKIAERWLEYYEADGRRPSSVAMAKLVVNSHLLPALKGKVVPNLAASDFKAVIDAIPAKQRGMRRAVYAYSSTFLSWAVDEGHITDKPLAGVRKPAAPESRDRVLSEDELAAIWSATTRVNAPFGAFFRLLILTAQRRSEVAGLDWNELSRKAAIWSLPSERAKNGIAHDVPLVPDVVAELDALAGGDKWPKKGFVFTTTGKTAISGISKAKLALDRIVARRGWTDGATEGEEEPIAPWRIHDLRRTAATGFQSLGVRFEVTEAVLNHLSGARAGVAGIYQRHEWKDEKRSALDAWARHVQALGSPSATDNVVSMVAA